jgi:thiol-disulfide isomerase/thioredoxin
MSKGYHKSKKNHKKNINARKTMKKENKRKKPIIVGLIHAEWCVHCKAMNADWEKLTKFLKGKVAKVDDIESTDSDKETKINELNNKYGGERLNGDSFPVVFKIQNNKIQIYNGERDFKSMKSWVFSESEPKEVLEITEERVIEPTQYNGNEAQMMVMKFMEQIRGGYKYNTPRTKNSKTTKTSKKSKQI